MNISPKCAVTLDLLDQFLDHELPEELQTAVAAHLQRCPKCKAEFEIEKLIKSAVAEKSSTEAAPPDLAAQVVRRLETTRVQWNGGSVVQHRFRIEFRD